MAPTIKVPTCEPAEGVVRCTVVLAEEERMRLEIGGSTTSGFVGLGNVALGWDVYYDNADLAVTLRGWWLLSRGGGWMLRVPDFTPVPAGTVDGAMMISGYKEICEVERILTTLGLVQHAEAYRSGSIPSVERLLAQAGVFPFARLRADRRAFRIEEMNVSIDSVRFDATFAEAEAVASALFERGNHARSALLGCFVQLELATPSAGFSTGSTAAEPGADALQKINDFLQTHGINRPGLTGPSVCPMLFEYLKRWRPAHLRAIRRVGAVPQENGELSQVVTAGFGANSSVPKE